MITTKYQANVRRPSRLVWQPQADILDHQRAKLRRQDKRSQAERRQRWCTKQLQLSSYGGCKKQTTATSTADTAHVMADKV